MALSPEQIVRVVAAAAARSIAWPKARLRLPARRQVRPRWHRRIWPTRLAGGGGAAGSVMLDSAGARMLSSTGAVILSDGGDNACCCGSDSPPPACPVTFSLAANLAWSGPGTDLDLFLAYDQPRHCHSNPLNVTGGNPAGIYLSPVPGSTCVNVVWFSDGSEAFGWGTNGTPFDLSVVGLRPPPDDIQDGGRDCGLAGFPNNENITGTDSIGAATRRMWVWYNIICGGGPSTATVTVTNTSAGLILLVNGGAVAPGASWTGAIASKGFESKGDGRFDYFYGIPGWTTVIDVQCGGPA